MGSYDFPSTSKLTDSAETLLRSALEGGAYSEGGVPSTYWWIKALLEKRGPMAEDLIPGLKAKTVIDDMINKIIENRSLPGLSTAKLVQDAIALAEARGNEEANDRDIINAVLVYRDTASTTEGIAEPEAVDADESATGQSTRQVMEATPTLDELGEDLTEMASQGKLGKVLGREKEIQQIIETLCREKKRNPALIGPAGVGKTAIIEGLAQRIVDGAVPDLLKHNKLISLQTSALVAGAGNVGDLDKRMSALLKEASQDGILLFIDEVHTIMGAGGAMGKSDVSSLLKPALARGEIACIVATTDVEYRTHIAIDAALERRFNPVYINEISTEHTLIILKSFRDMLQAKHGVIAQDDTLESLIQMAGRFMRKRRFPDKALDLLDHCMASAITRGKGSVTVEDAKVIVQDKVGMPVDTIGGLEALRNRFNETGFLQKSDAADIILRLQSTTEDLDLEPKRPNAVLLLHGDAVTVAEDLATSVASSIFGSANRMVRVDFSGLPQDHHINTLVGSPAGYIGHGDPLPHDPVQQTPWCVVWWDNIHLCHPSIRALLTRILQTGVLEDNRGQTTYFSDVVIMATAGTQGESAGGPATSIGFNATNSTTRKTPRSSEVVEKLIGKDFIDQCDLIISRTGARSSAGEIWIRENILSVTETRYSARGLTITWDRSFIQWLKYHPERPTSLKRWEGLLDEYLNPALREILRKDKQVRPAKVVVRSFGGSVIVEPESGER